MLIDTPDTESVAILDVRKGQRVTAPAVLPNAESAALLRAEAGYLVALLGQASLE